MSGITISEALRLVPDKFRDVPKIYAEYSLLWLPLSATAAAVKATVTTQDDSYFLFTRVKGYVTDNASPPAEITAPQLTYTTQIGSNLIQPDQNPVHIADIITNATKNGGEELDYPIWVPPSTTLAMFMTNLTGATVMNVRVKCCGIRFLTSYKGSTN